MSKTHHGGAEYEEQYHAPAPRPDDQDYSIASTFTESRRGDLVEPGIQTRCEDPTCQTCQTSLQEHLQNFDPSVISDVYTSEHTQKEEEIPSSTEAWEMVPGTAASIAIGNYGPSSGISARPSRHSLSRNYSIPHASITTSYTPRASRRQHRPAVNAQGVSYGGGYPEPQSSAYGAPSTESTGRNPYSLSGDYSIPYTSTPDPYKSRASRQQEHGASSVPANTSYGAEDGDEYPHPQSSAYEAPSTDTGTIEHSAMTSNYLPNNTTPIGQVSQYFADFRISSPTPDRPVSSSGYTERLDPRMCLFLSLSSFPANAM